MSVKSKPEIKFSKTTPIVAIRGSVVFPHTDSILSFGRQKSVAAINAAFQGNKEVAIFSQKDPGVMDPRIDDLYQIGTVATIKQMMTTEGEIHAMIYGKTRIKLDLGIAQEPYLIGRFTELPEQDFDTPEVKALARKLSELFRKVVNLGKGVEITTIMRVLSRQADPVELVDSVASILDIELEEKQKLLEILSVRKRLNKVIDYIAKEVNVLDLERMISVKTQKRFEDQMKKAMLREKKKTIEEELGEENILSEEEEIKEFRKKIKEAKMPKEVSKKAKKELKRLSKLSPHNPERGYLMNYLDWLTDMPWSISAKNNVSTKKAEKILDTDH